MRAFLKKHKGTIFLALIILSVYIVLFSLGISCPIKFIFGVSCPGCGMTRATLSALKLDFGKAFYYHPLWIILLPSVALCILFLKRRKMGAYRVTLALLITAFIVTYLIRLFDPSDAIVTFSPENSIIKRAIDFVFNF